jgi:phosphate starvation-inducible protein PhoH
MMPNKAVTASNMAMIPMPSARNLTARAATQSKEFLGKLNFESRMVILGNTPV